MGTVRIDPDDAPGPVVSLIVLGALVAAALTLLQIARVASA